MSVKKTGIVVACIGLAGCVNAAAAGGPSPHSVDQRKNVLFVIDEDIHTSILGCYGNPQVKTPHIDRFAESALRFENAYCQWPECGPSRASFMSGLRPHQTGILDQTTTFTVNNPQVSLIPSVFKSQGYHTANVGKILHNPDNSSPAYWDTHLDEGPSGPIRGQKRNLTGGELEWCWWQAAECEDSELSDGKTADAAIRFLETYAGPKPFFLAVGFHKPHDPFVAPKKYFELYPLDSLTLPQESAPADRSPLVPGSTNPYLSGAFSRTDQLEFLRARYACMSYMDAQFGRLMDSVRKKGLLENTVIVFIGDHGFHHGEHEGHWGKWTAYEQSLNAPCIIYDPDSPGQAGAVCPRVVEFIDLFPTLCDLCGVTPPSGLSGRSLAPLVKNPGLAWDHPAFGSFRDAKAVRLKNWKYMEWDRGLCGKALYDLQKDPGEYYNLSGKKEFEEMESRLMDLLHKTLP
jgi:uncharacterized sulfatase